MKRTFLLYIAALLLLSSCSTTKNTGASRAYHGMKVVHNVYFNGRISYDEGMAAINKANEDDFSQVIALYPISNAKAQQAAVSQMDKTIEKCRKSIKLHSIHAKPQQDPKRMGDITYRNWLKNKEFNSQMYRAWLLLAQAEFHKGDFLGSIGTFNYVSRLYSNDPDIVAQCQVWVARAYAELGWLYEAEDMIGKVKADNLKRENQPLYAAVSADIKLKGKHYQEAVPFIKVAMRKEKRSLYKPRFEFVLGQIYQMQGNKKAAAAAYKNVIGMQPNHEMDFQARLRYYELQGDTVQAMNNLRSMVKMEKNKDVLDALYGAMGNIYLGNGDTLNALRCYEEGIAKSTKNGFDKSGILVTAGDLYFDRMQYEQAAPCYDQASQILPADHDAYQRVTQRSGVLGDLVTQLTTVRLQDSLQYLSTLTPDQQYAVAEKIIADLRAKEEADSLRNAEQQLKNERYSGRQSVNTDLMIGGLKDNSWYFYNDDLLRKGKQQFQQKWGNRPLDDNWRRRSKTMASASQSVTTEEDETKPDLLADNGDNAQNTPTVSDIYQPEYYIQQIPKTESDLKASNEQIADALYALTGIYRDRLEDLPAAKATMDDYERRFRNKDVQADMYYRQYLAALKLNDDNEAQRCKDALVTNFPDTEQARIVSNPAYLESLRSMAREQDSVYAETYKAYQAGQYATVKSMTRYAEDNYVYSPLIPRFLFLNAVATARTEGQQPFKERLTDLVERYPNHELTAMAKSMLAMMGEGQQAQKGGSPSSLQDKRQETTEETPQEEQPQQAEPLNILLLTIAHDENRLNELLYEVAVFNFSQFLIKDFDLQAFVDYSATQSALKISGFDSQEEVEWYLNILKADQTLQTKMEQLGVTHQIL